MEECALSTGGRETKKAGPFVRTGFGKRGLETSSVEQVDRTRLLYRVGDLAMQLGGNSGHAARKDLSGFGGELGEKLRVGGDDQIGRDIMPATRHHAVRLTEIDTALDCFWLGHGNGCGGRGLAEFAMKGAALEEMVELHFLKTTRRAETLFVTRGDVTGGRLALGFRFGAF